jgi:outer membrane protein OmpA-like peptidoglycan-associated protein
MFSQTAHYRHVIEIFTEQQSNSPASSPLVGARLYVTYTIPRIPIKIFAGGGLDAILEHEGIIPLPTIEGGVSIRPFGFFKHKSRRQETELQEEDISEIIFAHTPENLVIEDGEQGKTMRLLNAVYFWANSTVFIEEYQHILDEAGRRLRENPDARITLRGYAAPFGTEAGQVTLSAARAWRCAEYLMQTYGIAEERVGMEFYGADKMPEWAGADWESWRCVELLIDANEQ